MRVIRRDDDFFAIECRGYSPILRNAAKMSPGLLWDKERKHWYGRADAVDLCAAHLSNEGIIVEASDVDSQPNYTVEYSSKLRAYQKEGVHFLVSQKRAILADDMGLGKTLTALSAAFASKGRSVLVVCPNRAKHVWVKELEKSFSPTSICLPKGRKVESLDGGHVWICNYEILDAWKDEFIRKNFDVVIFDECHNLMNEKSKRTIAARAVAKDASYVWGLSGTLIPNRVSDLYSIVETIRPGTFGTFFNFAFRYCGPEQGEHLSRSVPGAKEKHWDFDGSSHEDELRQRLAYFALRRTKTDVALELPKKTRQSIFLDVAAPAASYLIPSKSEIRRLLDLTATKKIPDILDAARNAIEDGEKVVIFTYRKSIAENIAASLHASGVKTALVTGEVPLAQREASIAAGHAGNIQAFVATIDSAGDAIDLSFASVAIFAELSYEPFKLLQAEARLHRFGQTRPVLVQYFFARGTIDELIAQHIIDKLDTQVDVGLASDGAPLNSSLREDEGAMLDRLYQAMAGFEEKGIEDNDDE